MRGFGLNHWILRIFSCSLPDLRKAGKPAGRFAKSWRFCSVQEKIEQNQKVSLCERGKDKRWFAPVLFIADTLPTI